MTQLMKNNPLLAYKSGMNAIYAPDHSEHYAGNPLLEALMPLHTREQIEAELIRRSEFFKPEWLAYDAGARSDILEWLKTRFFIVRQKHVDIAVQLKRITYARYKGINVFQKGFFLPSASIDSEEEESLEQEPENIAHNSAIIGPSGSGKTRGLLNCCRLMPQVIIHSDFKGRKLHMKQVCYIRTICPKKSGAKALWTNFYLELARVLGIQMKTRGWTEADLEEKIAQDVKLLGLAFIIIDEIQNLMFQKHLHEETLAAFTRLNELAGTPLIFVGTPEVGKFISAEMHTARRAAGMQPWKAMGLNEEWDEWLTRVLDKRLLRVPLPWSNEISQYFFDFSQGRVDLAVALFIKAQQIVLDDGREEIKGSDLDKAKEYLYLMNSEIEKVREGRRKNFANREEAARRANEKARGQRVEPPTDPEHHFDQVDPALPRP